MKQIVWNQILNINLPKKHPNAWSSEQLIINICVKNTILNEHYMLNYSLFYKTWVYRYKYATKDTVLQDNLNWIKIEIEYIMNLWYIIVILLHFYKLYNFDWLIFIIYVFK